MKGAPVIAVSCGDPAGIGPEIVVAVARRFKGKARLVLCGEKRYLERAAGHVGFPALTSEAFGRWNGRVGVLEVPTPGDAKTGLPSRAGGRASIAYLEAALGLVKLGRAGALVTAPINKEAVALAGYHYPGHTEFLGEKTGCKPVMMLACGRLRFSLVTTHMALRDVPSALTTSEILRVGLVTFQSLKRYFGLKKPRIAVMGLNPHAGEACRFGDEEKRVILPAVRKLAALSVPVVGPLPPDTVPFRMARGEFDAAVAMYHEQAALPVKTAGFHKGVNITLGLPFIRTSPDHGTAFDIAGKRCASHESMMQALVTAASIACRL